MASPLNSTMELLRLLEAKCGSDLWGERWQSVRHSFRTRLHEAGIILDVRPFVPELEEIHAAIAFSWVPIVDQVRTLQKRFKGMMRPLYNVLRVASHRPDQAIPIPDGGAVYLYGLLFFSSENLPSQLESALSQIERAIAVGRGAQSELGVRTVDLGNARSTLDKIAHVVRGARSFFTQEPMYFWQKIERLNLLMRGPTDHRYGVQGQKIVDLDFQTSIGLPDDFPVINVEPLRRLNKLINDST
jgi:hypothetical protein